MPVFECEAGAQAGLLEHEHHLLRVEAVAVLARIALDVVPELEDGAHFGAGEIGDRAQIFAGHARGRSQNVRILLQPGTAASFLVPWWRC